MTRGTKIFFACVGALILTLIILSYLHTRKMNLALSKLDSAMMQLDTAQLRLDSSRQKINSIQSELKDFQRAVQDISIDVMNLDIHSKQREQQFNRAVQNYDQEYEKNKKKLQQRMRTNWPNVTIDTTRSH